MPDLDTTLHIDMLKNFKDSTDEGLYGMSWGDPETIAPLAFTKQRFLTPYLNPEHTALEIGPGGGRWTKYLLGFRHIYAVEYYQELLDEIQKNFSYPNVSFIKNNGDDFPGIEDESIDYLFSFGVFVHLDLHIIEAYLKNMKRILKPGANVVLQYADKTKDMAKKNMTFSDNNPKKMRVMIRKAGFKILEEDLTTMWHSSIVRFTR